ncbi:hypothetical protein LCM19_04725 [Qipengyuania flava]|nr:hypothetical protein [Qipengyuania flava]
MNTIRPLLIAFIALFLEVPTFACAMVKQQVIEDINQADFIVSANVEKYELVKHPEYKNAEFALFTIKIDRSFKGNLAGIQHVRWHNSTFGLPQTRPNPQLILLAGNFSSDSDEGLPQIYPLQVFQISCSSAFIFSYDRQYEEQVWRAVNGLISWDTLEDALYAEPVFSPAISSGSTPTESVIGRENQNDDYESNFGGVFSILAAVISSGFFAYFGFRLFGPTRRDA